MNELIAIIDRFLSSLTKDGDRTIEAKLLDLLGRDKSIFGIQTFSGLMVMNSEMVVVFDFLAENRCWQMVRADNGNVQNLRQNTTAKILLDISKDFVQINKDCIVNINYLAAIDNKGLLCRLYPPHDHIVRKASKRYLKKIKDKLEII